MAAKAILAFCATALFVQSISSCPTGLGGYGGGLGGCGCGSGVAVSSGGGFPVNTYSPIAPGGISVRSENSIEGCLCVEGALPVLAAVAFQGTLPTAGSAGVKYSCGSGVGINSAGNGAGVSGAGLGYGAGLGGCGCGCSGRFY